MLHSSQLDANLAMAEALVALVGEEQDGFKPCSSRLTVANPIVERRGFPIE